ncbi:caspase family protein [Sandarakinorhabdus oryzae]|uniref:caspase family protein n=1 Tax=Sandarakinorhabdus oryzae TaxID=2675220 RepID=UPI0018CBF7F7|nr:caspase family protein [Sandarakinorhabdus oryzae]
MTPSTAVLALLTALLLPASASADVRAVFVGIDKYENSRATVPGAGFDDLSGAVGDTRRIRAALASSRGLDVGPMPEGQPCQSQGAAAITLINQCATKAAILAAWNRQLDDSQQGDTLLLYFAGHGSRFIDDVALDQASRYNSTLMAYDARRPGAVAGADIVDFEVRQFIDGATSRGVNVVTWFDSCNSGTASRDGNSATRTAPDLKVRGLQPIASPQQYGRYGAYRVHLGAAGDGQDAKEVGAVGARAGVFTTALAKAITATPQASFADLAARVVEEVTTATSNRQVPHAEGALRATLGGPEIKVPTFPVAIDGGRLVMAAGGLVGVTRGSRFALFATTGEALAGNSDLVAKVGSVDAGVAILVPEAPLPAATPGQLVAREIAHDFGGPVLTLAVTDPAALSVVQKLGFVRADPRGRFALRASASGLDLVGPTGLLASLPPPDSAPFGVQLAAALEKIARVERWLATVQPRDGVSLCVQNLAKPTATFDPYACQELPPGGRTLKMGQPIKVAVQNKAPEPRFVYVLAIGRKYSVDLVLPGLGAREPAIPNGQALPIPEGQELTPEEPGPLRFVALSSDRELNASVLEQTDTDVVDLQACLSPVARTFCQGADRARAGGWSQVGNWSAAIVNTRVEP